MPNSLERAEVDVTKRWRCVEGSKYPHTHKTLPHTDSTAGMEIVRHKVLSGLSISELVSLGCTNDIYFYNGCKKWILKSLDSPLQKVKGEKLGEGQGTMMNVEEVNTCVQVVQSDLDGQDAMGQSNHLFFRSVKRIHRHNPPRGHKGNHLCWLKIHRYCPVGHNQCCKNSQ